jgi:hypothetical protein
MQTDKTKVDAKVSHPLRNLALIFAGLGFLIALSIWAYSVFTAQSTGPVNLRLWGVLIALCPTSLLSVPLIDIEPGTLDFAVMWLVIGLANSALYGAVGLLVGLCLEWRRGRLGRS